MTLAAVAPALGAVRTVVPGVTYERASAAGQVTHVIRITPGPLISLRPERAGGTVGTRATLGAIMARTRTDGALVGVNGDLFNYAGGYPSGMLMIGGELVHEPEPTRTALGILDSGTLAPVRTELLGEWTSSTSPDPFPFSGLNRLHERNETILYTGRNGGPTPIGPDRTDAMIRLDAQAPLQANTPLAGTVVAQRAGGGLRPTRREFVLTGVGGGLAERVATHLTPGTRVTLRADLAGVTPALAHGLGGGPLLVADGVAVHDTPEGFSAAQVAAHAARTAVGETADGRLLLVVAEGPPEGSTGLTMNQLADRMAELGARTAVAMDGGGSATMAVSGRIVNRPASAQRAIVNALVVRYRGVQLSDPASVITPNGDGHGERTRTLAWAAKRGLARITIARPNGSTVRTLYSGIVGPSPRAIAIAGSSLAIRDGRYRVMARFTPLDSSTASTQSRPLTIDRTLGHLSVGKVGAPARLRIGFRLARTAPVTVTVTDARGRTVAVLMRRKDLPRGRRSHDWDMRVRGKRLAPGVYRVAVTSRADGGNRLSARFRVAS